MPLPAALAPMLCQIGKPFDSPEFLFEVKWDGVRALAFCEGGGHRLHSRHRTDLAVRYPELTVLDELPDGTLLDGELVVLQADGRPDFPAALARENARQPGKVELLRRKHPVTFVAFDLLYEQGQPLLERPLSERRERLAELLDEFGHGPLCASEVVIGQGRHLFDAVASQQLEGIIAKRLDSPYRPGERSADWQKIKVVQQVHCAILGYEPTPDGGGDFKSLLLASDFDGVLQFVGKVGTGFTAASRREVFALLQQHRCAQPWLAEAKEQDACWVAPGLFCTVSFLERTRNGSLRGPVFVALQS